MRTYRPWLSILIPVYNVSAYLVECLESIVLQTIPGIEIITLDDCSTDNSLTILQDFAKNSLVPIRILQHAHNRGLSAARNTLLDAAQGDYVWFIDSDDKLNDDAIQSLHALVRQHHPDLVLCDYRVLRSQHRLKHYSRDERHITTFPGTSGVLMTDPIKLFEGIYQKRKLHIWSKISRRELWGDDLRFPEGRIMEDVVVTPRLCLRVKNYIYAQQPWVIYRQREGSILSRPNQKKIDDMSIASTGVLALWLEKYPHLSADARFSFAHFCVRTHIFVSKELRTISNNKRPDMSTYRQHFLSHIQWDKPRMCWEYIKRGWVLKLRRFLLEY
ncbi:glycosyltransferase family 2 protein [Cellvibrio mixtus]|uniref:glycosyltransferase family 2 protein n=1 Tax=Cellvibrio mixtus TaxID=39650 RepID=UPI000587C361|nr:glycosyltransferase family 2 protein [Cellvibrio mixtus]